MDGVPHVVLASQFRDERDHPGLRPVAWIPIDPDVRDAERAGLDPLDQCPDSPAVGAVEELARVLCHEEVRL